MFNLGLTPPLPDTPAGEVRNTILLIESKLRLVAKPERSLFSKDEVTDILLDLRQCVERFTSPTFLIAAAVEMLNEPSAETPDASAGE